MAFPTNTTLIDDFNRADATPPSANWTNPIFPGDANLSVSTNHVQSAGASWGSAYWNASSPGPDTEIYVTWLTGGTTELVLRLQSPGTSGVDGYLLDVTSGNTWSIWEIANNVQTQLGANATGPALNNGDKIGFEAVSTTLTGYMKDGASAWASVLSRTDSSVNAAGRVGLAMNGAQLDDFSGGTVVAGGGAFSLNCSPGSFSVTGVTSGVVSGRVVSANPGSYAVTGAAASAVAGRVLSANPGSYAITGNVASLLIARILSADPASYVITGLDAGLLGPGASFILSADPGSFVIVGEDAGLSLERVINATPGSFAVTGVAAGVLADRLLSADPGSVTITGIPAGVLADRFLSVDPGSFAITGDPTGLLLERLLAADPGSFAITGAVAGLVPPSSSEGSTGPSRRVIHIRFGVYP